MLEGRERFVEQVRTVIVENSVEKSVEVCRKQSG